MFALPLIVILTAALSTSSNAQASGVNETSTPAAALSLLRAPGPQARSFSNTQQYYISSVKTDWFSARRACRDSGFQILQIKNAAKQRDVEYFLLENGITDTDQAVWIGISDLIGEGRWVWEDGSLLVQGNWYVQNGPLRDCGSFSMDFTWDPMFCKEGIGNFVPLRFICETLE